MPDSTQYDNELRFSNVDGYWSTDTHKHLKKIVRGPEDLTVAGTYMGVKLERMLLNLRLKGSHRSIDDKDFCLLEAVFQNRWDYRMSIFLADFSMIDSDGFQHQEINIKLPKYLDYKHAVIPRTGELVRTEFRSPDHELEAKAKTRGWLWFDALPQGIIPHRFIFRFKIPEPGEISGWVKSTETLELVINDFEVGPVKHLPPLTPNQ